MRRAWVHSRGKGDPRVLDPVCAQQVHTVVARASERVDGRMGEERRALADLAYLLLLLELALAARGLVAALLLGGLGHSQARLDAALELGALVGAAALFLFGQDELVAEALHVFLLGGLLGDADRDLQVRPRGGGRWGEAQQKTSMSDG